MLDVKKLLSKILDVFSTTSTTITGSYNLKAVAYRRCGIVTLNVWQTATANLPKGKWITVGTLPAQYRPVQQFDALGPDNNTSSVQNNSLQMRINTGGSVMVWAYSNGVTTNQLLASLTFIGGGYCINALLSTIERWWRYVRCEEIARESADQSSVVVLQCVRYPLPQLLQGAKSWQSCSCLGRILKWLDNHARRLSCVDNIITTIQTTTRCKICGWCNGRHTADNRLYRNNWHSVSLYNFHHCLLDIQCNISPVTLERGCLAC